MLSVLLALPIPVVEIPASAGCDGRGLEMFFSVKVQAGCGRVDTLNPQLNPLFRKVARLCSWVSVGEVCTSWKSHETI